MLRWFFGKGGGVIVFFGVFFGRGKLNWIGILSFGFVLVLKILFGVGKGLFVLGIVNLSVDVRGCKDLLKFFVSCCIM